jgi:probable selenate reductase FAD-binding subunit
LELKDWLGDDMFDHVRAFHRPRTVKETIGLLQQRNGQACLVAGGTDLALRAGRSLTTLVDIGGLGLDYIKRHDGGLRIGAACTMSALDESSLIQRFANGVLAQAAACCGTIQTRNVATIGGNLANASPAADTATPLLALDAQVVLHGAKGKRRVAIADFFLAPHQTVANSSLLTEIVVPAHKPRTAWVFQRFSRTEVDVAIVNVAVGVRLDKHGRCAWVRLALGAVAPRPMRASQAEAVLTGQAFDAAAIESAAAVVAQEVQPITDIRASAEYRRELSRVLIRRALQDCARNLGCAL